MGPALGRDRGSVSGRSCGVVCARAVLVLAGNANELAQSQWWYRKWSSRSMSCNCFD